MAISPSAIAASTDSCAAPPRSQQKLPGQGSYPSTASLTAHDRAPQSPAPPRRNPAPSPPPIRGGQSRSNLDQPSPARRPDRNPASVSSCALTRSIGALSRTNARATSRSMDCSSLKLSATFPTNDDIPRSPYFGKPSTCSAIMLACTWVVPPPMVIPKFEK